MDSCIQTYTGLKFWPLEIERNINNICIEDIAHALSMICRFGGHCNNFYSVAEHSYHVSFFCNNQLEGLLHDAAEAYLFDIPKPLKQKLENFVLYEFQLQKIIYNYFNVKKYFSKQLENIDGAILKTERNYLMRKGFYWSLDNFNNQSFLDVNIECWSPEIAEKKFLDRFYDIKGE